MVVLKYFDNLNHPTVCEVTREELLSQEDASSYLLGIYQNAGWIEATDQSKLYMIDGNKELVSFNSTELLEDATVIYNNIKKLDNADEYARENGISYFFHTSEKGHQNSPHIHARYTGEDISVYFKDYKVKGSMRSKTKQKEIIKYVKAHVDELQQKWNHLMQH